MIAALTGLVAAGGLLSSAVATAADAVTVQVPVGATSRPIAITPDGSRAYVGTVFGTPNQVAVIDVDPASPSYNSVIAGIDVSGNLQGIAITPSGTRVYASHGNDVVVIDADPASPTYNTIVAGPIAVDYNPAGMTATPDGSRIYIASGGGLVTVIDTATNLVSATITVSAGPRGLAVTPDGTRVYVTRGDDSTVAVIDSDPASASFNQVVANVADPDGTFDVPNAIAITPDGARAYVTSTWGTSVSVIDTDPASATFNQVVAAPGPFAVPGPSWVGVTPDGDRVYVANGSGVSVIDADPGSATYDTVTATVTGGLAGPQRLAITPDGTRVYVTSSSANSVAVVGLDTRPVIMTPASLPGGTVGQPYSTTIAASGNPAPTFSDDPPPGLTLAADGTLSGTPTAAGTFTFPVTASSSVSGIARSSTASFTIVIAAAPLPPTGSDVGVPLGFAGGAVLVGLGLVLARTTPRRRA